MGLRESAGISLEEVSNDINIPVIALEQIEAGTFGSFEDIYELKRWLVEYAKYIGYDTDKVIKEFNEYMFEHTSKIPSQEIVAAIKSNKKDEIIDDPDRIASPYTRAYPKEKTLPYILTFIVVLLLVALAVFWSVSQITFGNNSTDVLSYYTE
jgi:cytoskeletal protein RodZ